MLLRLGSNRVGVGGGGGSSRGGGGDCTGRVASTDDCGLVGGGGGGVVDPDTCSWNSPIVSCGVIWQAMARKLCPSPN